MKVLREIPMVRTTREKVVDSFLTLYLLRDAFYRKRVGRVEATRLQKLVFLSELPMVQQRKKGFNFGFVRLNYGPYSSELANEQTRLAKAGLIFSSSLEPTRIAARVLDQFGEVVARNGDFFRIVRETNDSWARVDLRSLLRSVHSMPWGRGIVHDLPPGTPMLYRMNPQRAAVNFDITEEEIEDLWMNFDPTTVVDYAQAMKEVRSGQLRTHEQLLATLRA
jgi:hypothetical protein